MTMHQVVYFSNVSENTKRFVEKLDVDAVRIPLNQKLEIPQVDKPFVLITQPMELPMLTLVFQSR